MSRPDSPIIVASPPVFGETVPLLQLAAGLVERGHEVITLVGRAFESQAAAAGTTVILLPDSADPGDQRRDNPERAALPPGPGQLDWDHSTVFVGAMTAQHHALQELLDRYPDAALLCNSLFVGAWPVALGAPGRHPRRWVAVAATPVFAADDATTPLGPVPGRNGEALVSANRQANQQFDAIFERTRRAANEQLRALHAVNEVSTYVGSIYGLPDAVAALTVSEFDFPRATAPEGLTYVGILPTSDDDGSEIPDWWGDLSSATAVVVVTQGTAANDDLGQLVEPTLRALAEQDVLVVAALGRDPSALSIDIPPNARVAAWVPFDRLLPRADLLITNGGFGGTQRALAQGVPVIVAGSTEDKPLVAAHVAFHEVGLDLGTDRPSADQIATSVAAVLTDTRYRSAAAEMAAAYSTIDAVSAVEALLQ